MNWQRNESDQSNDHVYLRRVDWRFLLSIERARKSICFGDGRLARSTAAISDICIVETASEAGKQDSSFDLAVAEKPDKAVLQSAFEALRPGGICYTEWQAWRAGGARRIRRRLESAGFARIRLYWVFPSFEPSRLWIPLQIQQAPGKYIARWLFTGDGLLQRVAREAFMFVFSFFMVSGFVPYICVVAQKPVSRKDDMAIVDVFSVIQAEWSQFHPEIPVEKLRYLPQTGGTSPINKIVMRVFVEPERFPTWVVKMSRLQENVETLHCEQILLRKVVQANKSKAFNLRVPEPIFSRALNGILLYGQTALAGASLSRLIKQDNLHKYALQLADWQVELMHCSKDWKRETTSEAYVTQLLASLEAELVGKEFSVEEFSRVRDIVSRLKDLPMTCAHNDFTVWNIIEMNGNLGVIDWVDGTDSALPLLDLFYALSSLVLIFKNAWEAPGAIDVYHDALHPDTPIGRIFAESISHYAKQVGLDPDLVAPLRMMTWMLRYSFELKKRQLITDGRTEPNQSMYLSLWKVELDWQQEKSI